MLLAMLPAFAEMQRAIIVERTNAGLARAKANGTKLGGPRRRLPLTANKYAHGWKAAIR
jgi:putative DNA-invertase from lambdoid prophage Rac